MKKEKKIFFRTVYLSSVIVFCIGFSLYGMAQAYENTRRIGFGEYKKAVEIHDGKIRIFDFSWNLPTGKRGGQQIFN